MSNNTNNTNNSNDNGNGNNSSLKYLNIIVFVNIIFSFSIFIFEILAIWIDIPILFASEGDPFGVSDISGNWFDHILKGLIALLLTIIFIRSLMLNNQNRPKAQSFAIGGSFIVLGLGLLYVLIWIAQFLDSALTQSLNEYIWYSGFRLEIVLLIFNLPVLAIWKNRFQVFQNMDSTTSINV